LLYLFVKLIAFHIWRGSVASESDKPVEFFYFWNRKNHQWAWISVAGHRISCEKLMKSKESRLGIWSSPFRELREKIFELFRRNQLYIFPWNSAYFIQNSSSGFKIFFLWKGLRALWMFIKIENSNNIDPHGLLGFPFYRKFSFHDLFLQGIPPRSSEFWCDGRHANFSEHFREFCLLSFWVLLQFSFILK